MAALKEAEEKRASAKRQAEAKRTHEKEKESLQHALAKRPKLMLHFDGKKYDENGNPIERLPLKLSGFPDGEDRLLAIPTIPDGKAKTISQTAHDVLRKEKVPSKEVVATNSDTTASNSGSKGGSLLEFDKADGKQRLHTFCRNHTGDLQQKRAYKVAFSATKSPANTEFKKFRQIFSSLNLSSIKARINEKFSHPLMVRFLAFMKAKCTEALQWPGLRSDRRQYAEMCLHINGYELPGNTIYYGCFVE